MKSSILLKLLPTFPIFLWNTAEALARTDTPFSLNSYDLLLPEVDKFDILPNTDEAYRLIISSDIYLTVYTLTIKDESFEIKKQWRYRVSSDKIVTEATTPDKASVDKFRKLIFGASGNFLLPLQAWGKEFPSSGITYLAEVKIYHGYFLVRSTSEEDEYRGGQFAQISNWFTTNIGNPNESFKKGVTRSVLN